MLLTQFPKAFKGDLILPDHPAYTSAIHRWTLSGIKKAGVVVYVKDEEDVRVALEYAKAQGLDIAVRGGGTHSSGASSSEGGMVIDLSRYMRTVQVDQEKQTVVVGGGCTLADVEDVTLKHGLISLSTMANWVGVGGFVLSGSYGYLTGEQGLACDNLLGATVVTGKGDIVQTSEQSHPDLFWGIRGGGGNFGVVTSLTLKCHPQRAECWIGEIFYDKEKLVEVVEALRAWWCDGNPKPKSSCYFQFMPVAPHILAHLFYNGEKEEAEDCFKAFRSITCVRDTTGEVPFQVPSLPPARMENGVTFNPISKKYVTSKFLSQPIPSQAVFRTMMDRMVQLGKTPAFNSTYLSFDYHSMHKVTEVPVDATACPFRKGEPLCYINISWIDDEDDLDKVAREEGSAILGLLGSAASSRATPPGFETDVGTSQWAKSMFGRNYHRLQDLKARYDPDNVFDKWCPIQPASKAGWRCCIDMRRLC